MKGKNCALHGKKRTAKAGGKDPAQKKKKTLQESRVYCMAEIAIARCKRFTPPQVHQSALAASIKGKATSTARCRGLIRQNRTFLQHVPNETRTTAVKSRKKNCNKVESMTRENETPSVMRSDAARTHR